MNIIAGEVGEEEVDGERLPFKEDGDTDAVFHGSSGGGRGGGRRRFGGLARDQDVSEGCFSSACVGRGGREGRRQGWGKTREQGSISLQR